LEGSPDRRRPSSRLGVATISIRILWLPRVAVAPRRFALRGRGACRYESREPLPGVQPCPAVPRRSRQTPSRAALRRWMQSAACAITKLATALKCRLRLPLWVVCHEHRWSTRRCVTLREMKRALRVRRSGADRKPPRVAAVKSSGGEHRGNAGTMTPAGKVVICRHVSGGAPSLAPEMILFHEDQFFAKSVCSVMPPHA
jgi:hypothetical protein